MYASFTNQVFEYINVFCSSLQKFWVECDSESIFIDVWIFLWKAGFQNNSPKISLSAKTIFLANKDKNRKSEIAVL